MSRTPEQVQADELLHEAIQHCAETRGGDRDGMLTAWIVVACHSTLDADGTDTYDILMKDGGQSDFIAYGLLAVGNRLLDQANPS